MFAESRLGTLSRLLIGSSVLLVVAMSACGVKQAAQPSATTTTEPPAVGSVDRTRNWDDPIAGERIEAMTDASPTLAFQPREPEWPVPPRAVFVTPSAKADKEDRLLAFVYDHEMYGTIDIIERLVPLSQAEYETGMREFISKVKSGLAEVVSVRDGTFAVLTTNKSGTLSDIRWREGSVEFLLQGSLLNRKGALELSEKA